jgi:hypothetical protein
MTSEDGVAIGAALPPLVTDTITSMSSRIPDTVTHTESRERFRDLPRPTPGDVSITLDGRRLDTPDKVRAFLVEVAAIREAEQDTTHV